MPDVQQASWEVAPAQLSAHSPVVEFGPVPLQLCRLLFWTVFFCLFGPGACREPMLWVLGDPDRCKGETLLLKGGRRTPRCQRLHFPASLAARSGHVTQLSAAAKQTTTDFVA